MNQKVNVQSMRQANRQLVLAAIRASDFTSRTEVARLTSLAKPTVGAIVEELLSEGLVEEAGLDGETGGVGRKAKLLRFNNLSSAYLGVEFGVGRVRIAVADALGKIRTTIDESVNTHTPELAFQATVVLIKSALRRVRVPMNRVNAIGVTLPGIIDQKNGSCLLAPSLGWKDTPLRGYFESKFRKPTVLQNIKDAGAAAEGHLGAAQSVENYLWLYLGSGVGAGVVIEGRPFFGSHGFSGEIGHCRVCETDGELCQCGRRGCLETIASGPAILRWLRKQGCPLDEDAAYRAALAGQSPARDAIERAGRSLGIGLSYLVNLFNPELVILGGSVALSGPLLLSSTESSLMEHSLMTNQVSLVLSELDETGVLSGAILLAMRETERESKLRLES